MLLASLGVMEKKGASKADTLPFKKCPNRCRVFYTLQVSRLWPCLDPRITGSTDTSTPITIWMPERVCIVSFVRDFCTCGASSKQRLIKPFSGIPFTRKASIQPYDGNRLVHGEWRGETVFARGKAGDTGARKRSSNTKQEAGEKTGRRRKRKKGRGGAKSAAGGCLLRPSRESKAEIKFPWDDSMHSSYPFVSRAVLSTDGLYLTSHIKLEQDCVSCPIPAATPHPAATSRPPSPSPIGGDDSADASSLQPGQWYVANMAAKPIFPPSFCYTVQLLATTGGGEHCLLCSWLRPGLRAS